MLNLTQHAATQDQLDAGVIEPNEAQKAEIKAILTFDSIPTQDEIKKRAARLTWQCCGLPHVAGKALIGGAPYLMAALEAELKRRGVEPFYAFSQRESVEVEVDGVVKKTTVFKHAGFIPA